MSEDRVDPLATVSLADAVRGRASVRRFSPDAVPDADVTAMVELAVRAANAGNAQPWRFVAVRDPALRTAMRDAVDHALDTMAAWPELKEDAAGVRAVRAHSTFFSDAPLVVAVFVLPYASRADELLAARGLSSEAHDRLRARPDLQSVGAAVQLLCTAAYALGYGSCWMTAPVLAAPAIEALRGVARPARLAALVPIGRPSRAASPSPRRSAAEVLDFR